MMVRAREVVAAGLAAAAAAVSLAQATLPPSCKEANKAGSMQCMLASASDQSTHAGAS